MVGLVLYGGPWTYKNTHNYQPRKKVLEVEAKYIKWAMGVEVGK